MSSDNVCDQIIQRKKQMVFSVPPIRLEKSSPYPSYTKLQLDMRRKAEILQYKGNSQASKGNNPTKKQQYSKIISGYNQFRSYATLYNTEATVVYNEETDISSITYTTTASKVGDISACGIVYSSSKNSGVPGPAVMLHLDPDIPLYNYKSATQAVGVQNTDVTDKIRFAIGDNISIADDVSANLFSLSVQSGIDQNVYNFEFEIPFSYFISGTATTDLSADFYGGNTLETAFQDLSFNMETVPFNFYTFYSNQLVDNGNSTPTIEVISDISNGFVFDLSNVDFGDPTDISYQFQGIVYGGIIKVSDVTLATPNGAVYDFKLEPNITTLTNNNANIVSDLSENFTPNPINMGVICNITDNFAGVDGSSNLTRMTLKSTPADTSYNSFRIKMIDYDGNETIFDNPFIKDTLL
uniref:Uncharacterized protein n=1 Tax=viral metagenome TaxID=1070528 RepID=A0A6C0AUB9_9ZZZZ|tara:strand:- start:14632 stop:15864 length:1233 start_codon:yes stop_codon:yes gene_type:complete